MPKMTKTTTTMRFNPLHPSGYCKYCREIQPGPCQKPGCLIKEAKAAEDFADKTLATPAERFPARPGPDFVDVLSVLSMHTNNNLSAEVKEYNRNLKKTQLSLREQSNLTSFLVKIHGCRNAGYDRTALKDEDVTLFENIRYRSNDRYMTSAMVARLNDLGYQVVLFQPDEMYEALVIWGASRGSPFAGTMRWSNNDLIDGLQNYTVHLPTGVLEDADDDIEWTGEPHIPARSAFDTDNRIWPRQSELSGQHLIDTRHLINNMETYRPRGERAPFAVIIHDHDAIFTTTQDGDEDLRETVRISESPQIVWQYVAWHFSTGRYAVRPWSLFSTNTTRGCMAFPTEEAQ